MTTTGPMYPRWNKQVSKYEQQFVDEVELLDANLIYAQFKFPDGHEDNVSLCHLALLETPAEPEVRNLHPLRNTSFPRRIHLSLQ